MSILKPVTIEENILNELRDGPRRTTELLTLLRASENITKQGFYTALRKLQSAEVVTVYKKNVSLNVIWIKDMARFSNEIQNAYLPQDMLGSALMLKPGENVSYVFTNLQNLDAFWGHTQSIIVAQTPNTEPVFTYDPHYWFYLARAESERKIVEDIVSTGRQFLMTVGSKDVLDRFIAQEFSIDELQYHLEQIFAKRNYYVVIIGNYVSEGWFDSIISREIDTLYASAQYPDESFLKKMNELIRRKARHKMRITHSPRKADQLKTLLGKNFYIKNSVQSSG